MGAGAFAAMILLETKLYSGFSVAVKILLAAVIGGLIGWAVNRLAPPPPGEKP